MARILVVDDEAGICNVLENILSKEGHEIFTANNGKEAFRRMYNVSPDLMILDIKMPEMDGNEVCERIEKDPFYSNMPILILSGSIMEDEEKKDIMINKAIMSKPFEIQELLNKIKILLKENRSENKE